MRLVPVVLRGRPRTSRAVYPISQEDCPDALAARRAHLDAAVSPEVVSFAALLAMGAPDFDGAEEVAVRHTLGDRDVDVLTATRAVGHLRSAAGGVALLHAVLAVHSGLARDRVGVVNAYSLHGQAWHAVLGADSTPTPRLSSSRQHRAAEPIAVVGLGAHLPGATDVEAFWQLLLAERDLTQTVPATRWDVETYFDADPRRPETTYTKLGCFAEPAEGPLRRTDPKDPAETMLLRAAAEAAADAGLEAGQWNTVRAGCVVGLMPFVGRRFLADIRVNSREFFFELEAAEPEGGG